MPLQSCLHILGLDTIVDQDHIHRAYRRQVRRWHPDQFTHQPEFRAQAEERLKQINHAYATLKDYLIKRPQVQKFSDTATQGTRTNKSKSEKPSSPFNWKQWFKPKKPRSAHQRTNTERNGATQRRGRTTWVRKSPSFNRVLRQAATGTLDPSDQRYTKKGYGTNGLEHRRCFTPRKKSMRIEGHVSTAPITPIKPISRIRKIGSSR